MAAAGFIVDYKAVRRGKHVIFPLQNRIVFRYGFHLMVFWQCMGTAHLWFLTVTNQKSSSVVNQQHPQGDWVRVHGIVVFAQKIAYCLYGNPDML